MSTIRRLYVRKRAGFDGHARQLGDDLRNYLNIPALEHIQMLVRYDIEGLSEEEFTLACRRVLVEAPVDEAIVGELTTGPDETPLAYEYLPGQYDQRADSAAQCIQILTRREAPLVRCATVLLLRGVLSEADINKVKAYVINSVDSREATLQLPPSLRQEAPRPPDVAIIDGFRDLNVAGLEPLRKDLGLAMSSADLEHCRVYFSAEEKRDPTLTELRVLDTYWSDHCRHTTFLSELTHIEITEGKPGEPIFDALELYRELRRETFGDTPPPECLMDIATIYARNRKRAGTLPDLEVSEEINAASIIVPTEVDGKTEEWLVMFKNETHNHPTEIEPFGGAATCVGGAIRDPLSGRAYVYQAMRVSGGASPLTPLNETPAGKLPQRKIATEAARGFSSYGNQIGLATGIVNEFYHPDYVAKRMEVGAVIAAAPRENVVRGVPEPGDVIVLLGGRTGRDGCGGATGSSKEHTQESLETAGAEVQKGNPPTERKIQRLFRNGKATRLIKRCNDFGAGGVSVAVGELAPGLLIDLDKVPLKYEGLDGTELAISESQERMAVVLDPGDVEQFSRMAAAENLEAAAIATVSGDNRLTMSWRGRKIVDISRAFLDTNGVRQTSRAVIRTPNENHGYFPIRDHTPPGPIRTSWEAMIGSIEFCSRKGLGDMFDSSIGAASTFVPYGGKRQLSPADVMVATLPVDGEQTPTATIMSNGFTPDLATWSPFHGGLYAVVEAVAKIVAAGGQYDRTRLSLQEYFEKLGRDPQRWGKPLAALLGALRAQCELGTPAIGGKDSMSGTFKDINVPPTLVAFAVCPADARKVVSSEFKCMGTSVLVLDAEYDAHNLPIWSRLKTLYDSYLKAVAEGKIISARSVGHGGIAAALTGMMLGNNIGMRFKREHAPRELYRSLFGSIICEMAPGIDPDEVFADVEHRVLGKTIEEDEVDINGEIVELRRLRAAWTAGLEKVYPTESTVEGAAQTIEAAAAVKSFHAATKTARPRVLIPVFPGSNCEIDSARAFRKAGAEVETFVFRNLTPQAVEESLQGLARSLDNSNILMLPGGFSAGDEPDGSGKFIAAVFHNTRVADAAMRLLQERDGLALGICNGFQALIKLGLLPYGEIRELTADAPTLTFNAIGRHVATMVRTRITTAATPWFACTEPGAVHCVPVSHGEGRFVCSPEAMRELVQNGQIAAQYVDHDGNACMEPEFNPNGSMNAVEALISPDGRILGKMAHSERVGPYVAVNIFGEKDQKLFEAGVKYFA